MRQVKHLDRVVRIYLVLSLDTTEFQTAHFCHLPFAVSTSKWVLVSHERVYYFQFFWWIYLTIGGKVKWIDCNLTFAVKWVLSPDSCSAYMQTDKTSLYDVHAYDDYDASQTELHLSFNRGFVLPIGKVHITEGIHVNYIFHTIIC